MSPTAQKQRAATHEVGHALGALAVGLRVLYCTIGQTETTLGHCKTVGPVTDYQHGVMVLSAMLAERSFFGDPPIEMWQGDLHTLRGIDNATHLKARQTAATLVQRHRNTVHMLANKLLAEGFLPGVRIKHLLTGVSR